MKFKFKTKYRLPNFWFVTEIPGQYLKLVNLKVNAGPARGPFILSIRRKTFEAKMENRSNLFL